MRSTVIRPALLVAVLLAALVGALGLWSWEATRGEREAARQLVFTIPEGAAARLAAGEELEVLPETILLALDTHDTLVIQNDDRAAVQIGPFKVEPGQRFVQRYYNPGTFDLVCTIHGSQRMRVVVVRSA
jgi:plastocyanin